MKPGDTPFLPRGVRLKRCETRDAWFLLAPERAVRLDAVGVEILSDVDGARDFGAIVARLAERFDAPQERISEDAGRFLDDLAARMMVAVR